jgi:hypothetical protein
MQAVAAIQLITEWQQTASGLKAAKQALDACLSAPLSDRPAGAAPTHILAINCSNPAPPVDVNRSDWTENFIGTPHRVLEGAAMKWIRGKELRRWTSMTSISRVQPPDSRPWAITCTSSTPQMDIRSNDNTRCWAH